MRAGSEGLSRRGADAGSAEDDDGPGDGEERGEGARPGPSLEEQSFSLMTPAGMGPGMLFGDVPRDGIEKVGSGSRCRTDPGEPPPSPVLGPVPVLEMNDVESRFQFLELDPRDFDVIGMHKREELPGKQFGFGVTEDAFEGRVDPSEVPVASRHAHEILGEIEQMFISFVGVSIREHGLEDGRLLDRGKGGLPEGSLEGVVEGEGGFLDHTATHPTSSPRGLQRLSASSAPREAPALAPGCLEGALGIQVGAALGAGLLRWIRLQHLEATVGPDRTRKGRHAGENEGLTLSRQPRTSSP